MVNNATVSATDYCSAEDLHLERDLTMGLLKKCLRSAPPRCCYSVVFFSLSAEEQGTDEHGQREKNQVGEGERGNPRSMTPIPLLPAKQR